MNANDLKLLHQWFQIPHVLRWYARNEKYTFEMTQEKYLSRINDATIPSFIIYDNDKTYGIYSILSCDRSSSRRSSRL
jgi:hypothetical protein